MINTSSLSILADAQFTKHFKRPLYQSYAFSRIPHTIMRLLTGEALEALPVQAVSGRWNRQKIVVLILIDGFGWNFFSHHLSHPFLKRFETEGVASKISSQFPSTTSAHISTICTGLEVGQTGIYEWFQYEPHVDRMISPLLYSFAGDHVAGTLGKKNVLPETLFPFTTLYEKLKYRSIESYVIQQESIIYSPYSKTLFKGAHFVPYRSFHEALDKAIDLCKSNHSDSAYLFLYHGDIDAAGHRHGIHSKEFNDAISSCLTALEEHFWQPLSHIDKEIATLVTADHGMAPVNPRTTLYLNKEYPSLIESLKTNAQGLPLVPAGSCRDFFLHIKEEKMTEVHGLLSHALKGVAEVYFVQDLIDRGFFGPLPLADRFLERVGNLVVLPYINESIWWYEKHHFEQNFHAAHGGLTPEELESIFLYNDRS